MIAGVLMTGKGIWAHLVKKLKIWHDTLVSLSIPAVKEVGHSQL